MKCPRYLLDTCICVFLMRDKFNIRSKIGNVGLKNCCISEITVAELLYGAILSKDENNIKLTKDFCDNIEIIPIFDSLMEFARQKVKLRKEGMPIDDFGLLIACGAIVNDLIVVTDNTKHFERLPVKLQNWVKR